MFTRHMPQSRGSFGWATQCSAWVTRVPLGTPLLLNCAFFLPRLSFHVSFYSIGYNYLRAMPLVLQVSQPVAGHRGSYTRHTGESRVSGVHRAVHNLISAREVNVSVQQAEQCWPLLASQASIHPPEPMGTGGLCTRCEQ